MPSTLPNTPIDKEPPASASKSAMQVIPKLNDPPAPPPERKHRRGSTRTSSGRGHSARRHASDGHKDGEDHSVDDDANDDEDHESHTLPEGEANLAKTKGLGRFRQDPVRFMIRLTAEGSAFFTGSGWRKYENYIGAPILYPDYTSDMMKAVMGSDAVQQAIAEAAQAEMAGEGKGAKSEATAKKVAKAKAENYAKTLIADLSSKRTLRFIAFAVNNLLVRLYHQGIYIKGSEFIALQEAAKDAAAKGISLLFLPSHKSHVDYLVISYVFYRLGLALPHIAAGQNLNIPIVGGLLKKGGAFFIRRSFGNDPLYSAIFKEYIETLLSRGMNIEGFIEGTRSRTGKLLPPRFGLLKIVLSAVMSGRIKDVMVCPMSIGYDKVIETESYVNELLGRPKEPESLGQLVNSTSVLQLKWGRIDVRFQKPWSLREFIDNECMQRNPTGLGPMENRLNSLTLLRALGYRVLSDINQVSVIMPSALVGTVILTLRGRGVSRTDLVTKVEWLRHQVLLKGGKVAEFGDATEVIVDRVLAILGSDMIGERKDLLEPVYFVKKRFELSWYRNQTIHLFITESILCAVLEVLLREHTNVSRQRLLQDVSFLSQLLRREFVFPPGGILSNMTRTITSLNENGVIRSIDEIVDRGKFDFYCFLLWPFVETYWLASLSLFLLYPQFGADTSVPAGPPTEADAAAATERATNGDPMTGPSTETWFLEKDFSNAVQDLAKTLYYEGELAYFESINKEILKNAWTSFQESGMLVYRGQHVALHRDWHPERSDRLLHKTNYIHRFRRDKDGVARFSPPMSDRAVRVVGVSAAKLAELQKNTPPPPLEPAAPASPPFKSALPTGEPKVFKL
ncbi:hypothetical protein GGF32_008262 [Allomyces javanicus]|nr:hypothetical protein GGF32_008262 [Allomyces javanicus]